MKVMNGIVCFLFAVSTVLPAQTRFVHAAGKDLVTPDGQHLLLRGTSLGNWLEPEGYMFGFNGGQMCIRDRPNLLQVVDQTANFKVRVCQIACIHFHEARIKLFLVL